MMMQRWGSKLRSLSAAAAAAAATPSYNRTTTILTQHLHSYTSSSSSSHLQLKHYTFGRTLCPSLSAIHHPLSFIQVRHLTKKEMKEKMKKYKPRTPITSKLKKVKMKCYSSFKGRFRVMADGQIRRWKEGKRHNAHLKSKKAKRRGRQPGIVPAAYAKVMKKLNFCG